MNTSGVFLNDQVAAALERVRHSAITGKDLTGTLPSPLAPGVNRWHLWALICFLRHEERQQWVKRIVENQLGGLPHRIGRGGYQCHPDQVPGEGIVPGIPGWRYYFHGIGCCLTRKDGVSIDVDFAEDGAADQIDPYFYSNFLDSLNFPAFPEQQIRPVRELIHAWKFDLPGLVKAGWLRKKWRFQLTPSGRALAAALAPLARRLSRLWRGNDTHSAASACWLALLMGDKLLAAAAARKGSLSVAWDLFAEAEAVLVDRAEQIRRDMRQSATPSQEPALHALAILGRQTCENDMRYALQTTPVTETNHVALQILRRWDAAAFTQDLILALSRFGPQQRKRTPQEEDRPRLSFVVSLCRCLLEQHAPENCGTDLWRLIKTALDSKQIAGAGEAAALCYLLDWKAGLQRLAKALDHRIPFVRMEAAAYLAIIGTPAAIQALVSRARGIPDEGGHEAAAALACVDDPGAERAVAEWDRRNDGYEDADAEETELFGKRTRVWTMDQLARMRMRADIRWHFDENGKTYRPLLQKWRPGER